LDEEEEIDPSRRNGPPHYVQVKVVCDDCNNRWMSQIETAVEPHLTPLILSEAITITPKVRRIFNSREGGSVKHLSATCNNCLAVRPSISHFFLFNLPVAARAPN
jgi:hypothetical protein